MASIYRLIHSDPILLRLPNQAISALQKEGIYCVEDLLGLPYKQLLNISGIGKKRGREIEQLLVNLPFDYLSDNLPANVEQDPFLGVDDDLRSTFYSLMQYGERNAERGLEYFRQNRVQNIRLINPMLKKYEGQVEGSHIYTTIIFPKNLAQNDTLGECTCPAMSIYATCKHIYALYFALVERQRLQRFQVNASGKNRSYIRLLQNLKIAKRETSKKQGELEYYMVKNGQSWSIYPKKIYPELSNFGQSRNYNYYNYGYKNPWDKLSPSNAVDRLAVSYLKSNFNNQLNNSYGRTDSTDQLYSIGDVLNIIKDRTIYLRVGKITRMLSIQQTPYRIVFQMELNENGQDNHSTADSDSDSTSKLQIQFQMQNGERTLKRDEVQFVSIDPCWIYHEHQLHPVEGSEVARKIFMREGPHPTTIDKQEIGPFMQDLYPILLQSDIEMNIQDDLAGEKIIEPKARLYLGEQARQLCVDLRVAYGDVEIKKQTDQTSFIIPAAAEDEAEQSPLLWKVPRQEVKEQEFVNELIELGLKQESGYSKSYRRFTPTGEPMDWIMEYLPKLAEKHFEIYGEEKLQEFAKPKKMTKNSFRVSSGINWFELEGEVSFEDVTIPITELMSMVDEGRSWFKLTNGDNATLSENWKKRLKKLGLLFDPESKQQKIPKVAAPVLDELAEEADSFESDTHFHDYLHKIKEFEKIDPVDFTPNFKGELRPYQQAGLSWMYFLHQHQLGGILADDMGLGKTIQVLALLAILNYKRKKPLRSLVIAPRSVLHNWQSEANRFVPDFETYIHHGTERVGQDAEEELPKAELTVTTYGTMRNDLELLNKADYDYIILDESHTIRNPASKTFRSLRTLESQHRLCLTGTPVQNTTMDLWSQMEFANPGFLGGAKSFKNRWVKPIEKHDDKDAEELLHNMTSPFILRRTKQKVADDLPPITISRVDCDLLTAQERVYEKYRRIYHEKIQGSFDERGLSKSRFTVLEGLTRLRQICCSPELLKKEQGASAKITRFLELAEELISEGHRALVFSQFVSFLKMIEKEVQKKNWDYEYLDGSTTNRQERVDRFQEDKSKKLFLISLKAGGEGLNLTKADYVCLMDPWWNPAAERQAMDRTHRIGQNSHVFVYRFVTPGTVEEKIMRLQEKKQGLADKLVVAESGIFKELERDDLLALFE